MCLAIVGAENESNFELLINHNPYARLIGSAELVELETKVFMRAHCADAHAKARQTNQLGMEIAKAPRYVRTVLAEVAESLKLDAKIA